MDALAPGEFGNFLIRHLRLHPHVTLVVLVGNNYDLHVSLPVFFHLGNPNIQVVEALLFEEIEAKDDPFGSLVVCVRDRTIPLLPRRVPDLQLYFPSAVVDGTEAEVDSNGSRVVFNEVVVSETH